MKLLPLFFIAIVCSINAQVSFDPNIPSPKQVLGYELGDRFTSHAKLEKYILALQDAAQGKVKVFPYGETYEGRTLYLVAISSLENISKLDEIKSNIRKLSDPRITPDRDAESIMRSTPAIVWLSYGVHGNEASSSEAALDVMYQLAARTDSEMRFILTNVVVVIDPLLNPDGHERYVNFEATRSGVRPVEDRAAAEHNEDWPSGRTNHYLFDLNRDWAWLTQKESAARIKVYQEWKPQVHVDFHEMGYNSSYFFFPSFKPVNKNIPPSTMEWDELFGRANAAAFDAKGWSYWSGEVFDLFYPGFGDSWPSLNGAIGMTYEQAGQTGIRVKRNDDAILTLRDRLDHHATASLATIKATADNRAKRLHDFYTFFKDAIEEGQKGPIRSFIIDPAKNPSQAAKLISLLKQQGVEVLQAQKEFSLDGCSTYFTRKEISKTFPVGSYVVPLDQPEKRLVMTLMEQEPAISDTFFYDISTWALPVAYGVETYWTGKSISAPMERVDTVELPKGSILGGKASYAYVFRWNSNDAIKALVWLMQHDYRTHVAMRGFTMNGERFSRGSIIIPVSGNPKDIHEQMQSLAETYHITIYSAKTGYTDRGINLGSDRAVRLKKPKIAVITSSPVGSESFGAIWSMFDQVYGIDFVPMKLNTLKAIDLHDYTAIVFPDDYSGGHGFKSQLDSNAVQKIKTWIAAGGTFVGIEGGAAFASASVAKISSVKVKEKKKKEDDKSRDEKKDTTKEAKLSDEELEKRMTVEERERKERLESIPGTMLRVKLDNSHPLGFGYDSIVAVLKTTSTMFELSPNGYNVGIYTKSPRLSGYLSKENEKLLEETPFLVHEPLGAGNVILFADDPNFRLFWDNLNKVFLNSVLIMPSIRDVMMAAEGTER